MKKLAKNTRVTEQERRDLNSQSTDAMERRKRPDRRLTGLDVRIIEVAETAFMNFIHQLLPKK